MLLTNFLENDPKNLQLLFFSLIDIQTASNPMLAGEGKNYFYNKVIHIL